MIDNKGKIGALGRIRTPDPLVRSQILYPTELPARDHDTFYCLNNFYRLNNFYCRNKYNCLCNLNGQTDVTEVAYFPCFSSDVKLIIAHFLLITLLFIAPSFVIANVSADNSFIKIGVLNNQNKMHSDVVRLWEPTADYLAMKLPGYDFEIVPLGFYEVEAAVGQGKVDFILTNPGIFVSLAARNWVTPLATMNNVIGDESYSTFAGVIFTRHDNKSINSLADLKGKRFIAVNENSLGGFQMAWREMHEADIDPYNDVFQLVFANGHQQVVQAVIDGKADAGTVRTDTLEQLYREGYIDPSLIRIINPKQSADFPLARSTRLYPEWPLSKVQHVSSELAEKVTLTLVRMHSDFPSRFSGGYAKWTLPKDYSDVRALFMELKLPPYALTDPFTLTDALSRYWYWALLGFLTLLALLITVSSASRRNKRLELAKRKLEYQHELIVNSVTDGIYGVDKEGRCTFVNRAMQDMTGWQLEDLLGKELRPLLHHTRKDGSNTLVSDCPMYNSFEDSSPHFNSDDIFWKKDGRSIAVEYSSTPIIDQVGYIIGGVVVFRDISERKEAREKLQQHEFQLSHVSRLSMLGEMASGIAHEINQPLTAITTNSIACIRMLEANDPNLDKCADTLEKVVGQAERAAEVIRHIRHFVAKETQELQPVCIQDMIDTVLDLLHSELQRQDIKLILNITDPTDHVLAQGIQIEQVIMNLVHNAVEALESNKPHQRQITLSTAPVHINKLEIRVTDNGHGVSNKVLEQLFDPFVTTKPKGMGLGLSISQGIVEAHGDRIHVDSDQHGASFYFSLMLRHP